MKEYNGNEARNARININYTGKKPKVSFSYPVKKKDSRTTGSMMKAVFVYWFVFVFVALFVYALINLDNVEEEKYVFNSTNDYNLTNYDEFVEYYTQEGKINYQYNFQNHPFKESFSYFLNKEALIIFIIIIIIPFLIYFPFKKKQDSKYPDHQAFIADKKYAKFTSKDIRINNSLIYIELPVFENVICDFNPTKDFNKYLTDFEIREYNFKYKLLNKKTRKIKKVQNELIWYARWYFYKEPKEGVLEVIFK